MTRSSSFGFLVPGVTPKAAEPEVEDTSIAIEPTSVFADDEFGFTAAPSSPREAETDSAAIVGPDADGGTPDTTAGELTSEPTEPTEASVVAAFLDDDFGFGSPGAGSSIANTPSTPPHVSIVSMPNSFDDESSIAAAAAADSDSTDCDGTIGGDGALAEDERMHGGLSQAANNADVADDPDNPDASFDSDSSDEPGPGTRSPLPRFGDKRHTMRPVSTAGSLALPGFLAAPGSRGTYTPGATSATPPAPLPAGFDLVSAILDPSYSLRMDLDTDDATESNLELTENNDRESGNDDTGSDGGDLDGGAPERVTFSGTFDAFPMFSPDGTRLLSAGFGIPHLQCFVVTAANDPPAVRADRHAVDTTSPDYS